MFCKKSTKYQILLLAVGAISFLFGMIGHYNSLAASGNVALLLAMFTGFGAAWIVLGIIFILRNKFMSKEKLKQEEINLKDERNIQIYRASFANANTACTVILALMSFLFVGLGYQVPALIAIGALWVQTIVFFASHFYYSKKM